MSNTELLIWSLKDSQYLEDYPTNVHKLLGIKGGQRFKIRGGEEQYVLTNLGVICTAIGDTVPQYFLSSLINTPQNIIPIAVLTGEQKDILEAGIILEMSYVAMDKDGRVEMYDEIPTKGPSAWYIDSFDSGRSAEVPDGSIFSSILSWEDGEPTKIRSLTGNYSNIHVISRSKLEEQGA